MNGRRGRRTTTLDSLWQDVRHARRSLSAHPGASVLAIGMLALGIGITTAMFTIVDALVLRPVPFEAPDELASIYMGSDRGGRRAVAPAVLRAWRESPAFAGAESAVPDTALVEIDGTVAARGIARVTTGLFDLLGGVQPIRGRLFDAHDGRAGSDDRVLLSEDVWHGLFQSDPSVVGRRITVDGEPVVVIGILPSEFRFPSWNTVIWRPIDYDAPPASVADARPMVYVRFAPHVPRADSLRLATDAARAADGTNAALRPIVRPVAGLVLDAYYQRAVPLLAGGVILVFLVLCANVSSLLLARLTARRHELGIRAALGASRARLVWQSFVESGILGLMGAIAGAALAWVLVSLARTFLPESFLLRTLNPLNVDPRALGAASVASIVATIAAGLLPSWLGTRADATLSLRVAEPSDTKERVVIGERLARTLWPDRDPIGRTFRFQQEQFQVIGLVREIHHPSLDARLDRPEFYEPFSGVGSFAMMSVRCGGACPDAAALRQRLAAHPGVRVVSVQALEDVYSEQLARPRAAAALGFSFAGIAVLASAGGLFSVLTYAVGRRRREFGIRTALGASPAQIRRLVVRDGLLVAAIGIALGGTAAWSLARTLASLQYGVTMSDPLSLTLVLALLGLTIAAAAWRPAREAMRVDPLILLKEE